jgi:hypothetical protein
MVRPVGAVHTRAMPRLVVMWEPPLGLRSGEAEVWAYEVALEVVGAPGVQGAEVLPLRPASRGAVGYRWLLTAEVSAERVVDNPAVRELLHDLASLRTRPLVALANRAVPVCAD